MEFGIWCLSSAPNKQRQPFSALDFQNVSGSHWSRADGIPQLAVCQDEALIPTVGGLERFPRNGLGPYHGLGAGLYAAERSMRTGYMHVAE